MKRDARTYIIKCITQFNHISWNCNERGMVRARSCVGSFKFSGTLPWNCRNGFTNQVLSHRTFCCCSLYSQVQKCITMTSSNEWVKTFFFLSLSRIKTSSSAECSLKNAYIGLGNVSDLARLLLTTIILNHVTDHRALSHTHTHTV